MVDTRVFLSFFLTICSSLYAGKNKQDKDIDFTPLLPSISNAESKEIEETTTADGFLLGQFTSGLTGVKWTVGENIYQINISLDASFEIKTYNLKKNGERIARFKKNSSLNYVRIDDVSGEPIYSIKISKLHGVFVLSIKNCAEVKDIFHNLKPFPSEDGGYFLDFGPYKVDESVRNMIFTSEENSVDAYTNRGDWEKGRPYYAFITTMRDDKYITLWNKSLLKDEKLAAAIAFTVFFINEFRRGS